MARDAPQAPMFGGHDEGPRRPPTPEPFSYSGPPDLTALLPWMDDLAIGTSGSAHDEVPSSVAPRAPVETRVAEAEKPRPKGLKNDQNWTSLVRGAAPERWAPNSVQLPANVVSGLDDAYTRSMGDGNEHGGNIVRRGENYSARATEHGAPNTFDVDEKNVGRGNTFVGSYHTHPDTKKPGDQNTTFSGDDLGNLVGDDRRVSLLRSSKDTHMLAKTKEFDEMVAKAEDHQALSDQMKAAYEAAYQKAMGGTTDPNKHAAAMDAATKATAQQYHLLYFSGRGANLKRAGGPKR